MKQYINRIAILSGCALALAACDDNSWNDKLDGFEDMDPYKGSSSVEYTMTQVDYASLAGLSSAKAYAESQGATDELKAMGSQGYFTDVIDAESYLPFFLADERFPYFALSNGSYVRVNYETMAGQPAIVTGAANAEKYTVTADDYMTAWDSDQNYTEAFAPSCTAAKNIPNILKNAYADATEGQYVIVSYNNSSTDPVFGGSAPETPAFEPSSVLGSISKGDAIDIKGVVTALSTQGPIITDASGSVFCYQPTNNNDLKLGDQVELSANVDSYNYAFQLAKGSTADVVGTQAVTYPTPKTWTGAEIDAFVAANTAADAAPISPVYSQFTGTVTVSGNYINIILDGTTVQVSPYGATNEVKALLTDGATVTFEGYVMAIASKGKYFNTIITKVGSKPITSLSASAAAAPASRAVTVASTAENAMYMFDGSKWTAVANMTVLNHADYQAMGQSYDNLSGNSPKELLPTYLRQTYPYAQADDIRYVVYTYYNGSTNVIRCAECRYTGTEWTGGFNGTTVVTAQFVKKAGTWVYSPDVEITLPAGRGVAISTLYYQTCVDWVAANVPDGSAYVSSYGNNEYYCGTSAYQGNVDLRASAAKTQYPGYDSMTDDEVIALEKERFEKEVFPAALAIIHPDAAPTSKGVEPFYTIHFFYYTGSATLPATIIYQVTAPGVFTFQSCTWNEE
ncbi:MAG: hypothetical protein HDR49_04830 [Bacteroides sp.]|nr:hypothetical protein [Bacteroides sp.]